MTSCRIIVVMLHIGCLCACVCVCVCVCRVGVYRCYECWYGLYIDVC